MHGFQLWANLPSSLKMTRPRYQDISGGDIPEVTDDDGTRVRVICGSFWEGRAGRRGGGGPALSRRVGPAGQAQVAAGRDVGACVCLRVRGRRQRSATPRSPAPWDTEQVGRLAQGSGGNGEVQNRSLVLFDSGDTVTVRAGDAGIRFLLVSGKHDRGAVAWYGPIVMNTPDELRRAYAELQDGTSSSHARAD